MSPPKRPRASNSVTRLEDALLHVSFPLKRQRSRRLRRQAVWLERYGIHPMSPLLWQVVREEVSSGDLDAALRKPIYESLSRKQEEFKQ